MSSRGHQVHHGLRWAMGTDIYQFIGTGDFMDESYIDPDFAGRHVPRYYATQVTIKNGGLVSKPLYSNYLEDTQNPPRWHYELNPWLRSDHPYLKIEPAHQPDMMGLRYAYQLPAKPLETTKIGAEYTASMWVQSHPCNGIGNIPGAVSIMDQGYDYPPVIYKTNRGQHTLSSADYAITDWWRTGTVRTVTLGDVSKTFVIMNDVNNKFYAYIANQAATTLKTATFSWPAGLVVAAVGETVGDYGSHDLYRKVVPKWDFNLDGTKAVCVVMNREEAWTDGQFTHEIHNTDGSLLQTIQGEYPWMVEVNINLTLTGAGPTDFTFSVTVNQFINPKIDRRIPAAVGYAAVEMGSVQQNSLLMMEYENFVAPIEMIREYSADYSEMIIPAKMAQCVVKNQTESGWVEVRRWLAVLNEWQGYEFGFVRNETPDNKFSLPFDMMDFATVAAATPTSRFLSGFDHVLMITQINTIDLPTLSFLLTATVHYSTEATLINEGALPISPGTNNYYRSDCKAYRHYADSAYVVALVKNTVVEQRIVGNEVIGNHLADALLFNNGFTIPITGVGSYSEVYISDTIDYSDPLKLDVTEEYTTTDVTIHNGDDTINFTYSLRFISSYVAGFLDLAEPVIGYQPLFYHTVFDPDDVYQFGYTEVHNDPDLSSYDLVLIPSLFLVFNPIKSLKTPGLLLYNEGGAVGDNGHLLLTPQDGSITGFQDYPFGCYFNMQIRQLTQSAMRGMHNRLLTHPNGSWSVFYGPIAARKELYNAFSLSTAPEQVIIDKVALVDSKNNTTAVSTHLNLFNAAFDQSLSYNDLLYSLSVDTDRAIDKIAYTHTTESDWFTKFDGFFCNEDYYPIENSYYRATLGAMCSTGVIGPYFSHESYLNTIPMIYTIPYTKGNDFSYPLPNIRMEAAFHFGKRS